MYVIYFYRGYAEDSANISISGTSVHSWTTGLIKVCNKRLTVRLVFETTFYERSQL